jgi:hypothetical protein
VAWPQDADDTGEPYHLPYPGNQSLANVPADLNKLATQIEKVLDTKAQRTSWTNSAGAVVPGTDAAYQPRIKFATTVPDSTVPGVEGDIVIVISP